MLEILTGNLWFTTTAKRADLTIGGRLIRAARHWLGVTPKVDWKPSEEERP
jgi:hypothetical protein